MTDIKDALWHRVNESTQQRFGDGNPGLKDSIMKSISALERAPRTVDIPGTSKMKYWPRNGRKQPRKGVKVSESESKSKRPEKTFLHSCTHEHGWIFRLLSHNLANSAITLCARACAEWGYVVFLLYSLLNVCSTVKFDGSYYGDKVIWTGLCSCTLLKWSEYSNVSCLVTSRTSVTRHTASGPTTSSSSTPCTS